MESGNQFTRARAEDGAGEVVQTAAELGFTTAPGDGRGRVPGAWAAAAEVEFSTAV
jgi:hypothetical protein